MIRIFGYPNGTVQIQRYSAIVYSKEEGWEIHTPADAFVGGVQQIKPNVHHRLSVADQLRLCGR